MKYYVGFDMGGTTIKYGVIDAAGKIVTKDAVPTEKEKKPLLVSMRKVITAYRKQYDIAGVGVSIPGIVRRDGFMITAGAIKCLNGFPLADKLSTMTDLPVHVENDANAAAIAEHWLGNAQGVDDYICVVLGTGVGGGIVINGDVYRGAHGMAGEFGWTITHDFDLTKDLEDASLNWHAAVVSGLVHRYNESAKQVYPKDAEVTDAREIIQLARDNDPIAAPVLNQFMEDISIMVVNMFASFDPELILIGGGISANDVFMGMLMDKIREFLTRHKSLNYIKDKALGHVKSTGLHNDAGLIGAVYPLVRAAKAEKKLA
ncbi:ROK family protein [Schleiferilactobacillus shenzhenensis]|uniref:ROK family protein n=1 Tax=Schleiferilactobacillus shenzhenensis LY-73 TaxID=1231336 RepID=U4TUN2_9LACO|nr:ROK family protein [Schleiferilactobacillus shenzhenensis]ERL65137.1 hypothetical protein L248_3075 [Schleiferilactobacillus shenzhenensis LY-73]